MKYSNVSGIFKSPMVSRLSLLQRLALSEGKGVSAEQCIS